MIRNNHYSLQKKALESSFQIGSAEKLHQNLAGTMRTMLLGSKLGSDYWSDALLHAVHLKNILPHQSLKNNIAPHEAWTNEKPELSHLRIFDSGSHEKKHGIRRGKLDASLITMCMTLCYTPEICNTMCHDTTTRDTKPSRHLVIDEAH